ncbi:MAG: NAD(P)(+) transhydrogenase (Re/Si-specific) subunit beta [Planctomycetota bacterium]
MEFLTDFAYLAATALLIFGLKNLSKVRTSRHGNFLASLGMLLAIVATLVSHGALNWTWVVLGLALGSGIGVWLARTVKMTGMPEMVALLNGFGGIASLLVALSSFWGRYLPQFGGLQVEGSPADLVGSEWTVAVVLSVLVGGVTFTGSLVAMGKLAGKISGKPILLPSRHLISIAVGAGCLLAGFLGGFEASGPLAAAWTVALALLAGVLGVLLVIPIGGADMPVVISLLNSYSGIAASMTGFVLGEPMLISAGALVGASGLILTNIMCKAMNRSLGNVLVGGFGDTGSGAGDQSEYTGVKSAGPEEAAMMLESAGSVIIVPGYGMAVAQAQHVVKELAQVLGKNGATVRFAIHPVAGRMPGHMNVLLAEADVPYEQLFELERINGDFKNTDVALVVGANDVVNPAANDDPSSPIAGMPVLNVKDAQTVLMVKRSLSPGYAGIKNPLFERDNTLMCFGDGKAFIEDVVKELKAA